jgi:UDP:flavonoid glycosyltransferase YjiC (YdhE family)
MATPDPGKPRKRVVITTMGSLGDLHPYIAIALGLRSRGHDVVVATSECYRRKVEATALNFWPIRPDSAWLADPAVANRMMNLRWGLIRVLREIVLPAIENTYEDTRMAAEGADLLVSHPLTFATRLVAEVTGIRWASTMVTPTGFYSDFDPPLIPGFPAISRRLRFLGPAFWNPLYQILRRASRSIATPWYRLRRELGLPAARDVNPLVDGHSPELHLALFSSSLAAKQPDWPPQTRVTGFAFHDFDGNPGLPPELAEFLNAGPPPIVFTLGSTGGAETGGFYEQSIAAAKRLGIRAVLILGRNPRSLLPALPAGVVAEQYAPFSFLFPRASAIVHHGGIGTTGLAMRAGRPTLIVPHTHDQPDNAERASRLGIARVLPCHRFTGARAASELARLLSEPAYRERSLEVQAHVQEEDGVRTTCDALEHMLGSP